ncbi:CDP-diacylglycerol--serine O-phosphatidyltransferase [Dyella kyungheensis]|uniref:CDP-diacylglycerol--serine O-phosphatidyltransferase n=1 Tax=Dyella kyungheensis TaxID=1242174 RepID=A0ABS2JNK3_9GAMM|nr:CDP-diacylglycerol--serine O-phosphatidyltransferase [Dyella kyungheensis]MBM7120154.1 CDP-diacylglycerol--serine O-phosphatidyltransferase [Dyella kyungheensis]
MNRPLPSPRSLARRLLSLRRRPELDLSGHVSFAAPAEAITTLAGPAAFRETLLALIAKAQRRIVLVALYLQDDDAGREVIEALHAARAAHPALSIEVYVDWHRARRGLIGKGNSEGNATMYRDYAQRLGEGVVVRGVPVQTRELFGVLHLKGFIIDDAVLYSGASINDVYLARHGRYRLDRYHLIRHKALADSMAAYVDGQFRDSDAVPRLDRMPQPRSRDLQEPIRRLRQSLQQAQYTGTDELPRQGDVTVIPLAGFGRNDNALNETLLGLLRGAQKRVILLTPYFNLPRQVRVVIGHLLRRGCQLDIMVGDKTANDFYIPPEQPFSRIGLLPYLYEANLRRFARTHQGAIDSGQLNLWLWRDGDNTYHLKGLFVDEETAVLTGNNLNPRAWALDLENGLLLRDPWRKLVAQHEAEWQALRSHATRLAHYRDLPGARGYPPEVRKLLRRLRRVRLDRLVNRLL